MEIITIYTVKHTLSRNTVASL